MGFLIRCPICDGNFQDGRPYTGTSGVVFPDDHPLFPFCDAGLHLDCLESWPHRAAFSFGYFSMRRDLYIGMKTLLGGTAEWVLGCGPAAKGKQPYYAEVDLAEWPCRLYTHYADWESFVSNGYRKDLSGKALEAATVIMDQVRVLAPDLVALEQLRKNS